MGAGAVEGGGLVQTQPTPAMAGKGLGNLRSPVGASLGPKPTGSVWTPQSKRGGMHHRGGSGAWAGGGKTEQEDGHS